MKNCFITGATGGIGREIAKKFANYNLFLTSTNNVKLEKLKKELQHNVFVKEADLNKSEDIDNLIKEIRSTIKTVDILVNCAGVFPVKLLEDSTVDDYDECFNINVKAPFLFAKEFSKDMKKNKWGRIINIGSSSAYAGFKNTSLYCASKHALLGLSRSLFDELKQYNIKTIFVAPGSVKTEMGKKVLNQDFDTFIDPKELADLILKISLYDDNMVIPELKVTRMWIQ